MSDFVYEIRKISGGCSGNSFALLTVNQSYCDTVYPGLNSAFETTEFLSPYPPTKEGFTTIRARAKSHLSPMGSNTPSNNCTKTACYNTDTNGLEITFDGTYYYLPSGELIGTTIPEDLEQYVLKPGKLPNKHLSFFEDFGSKNLSYLSKRKR